MELASLSKEEKEIILKHRLSNLLFEVDTKGETLRLTTIDDSLFLLVTEKVSQRTISIKLNEENVSELNKFLNYRKSLKKSLAKLNPAKQEEKDYKTFELDEDILGDLSEKDRKIL